MSLALETVPRKGFQASFFDEVWSPFLRRTNNIIWVQSIQVLVSWFNYYSYFPYLKGLSHEIFVPVFLGCMDVSGPECEPLVVFNFNDAPFIF